MKKLFVALFAVAALCFTAAADGNIGMNHADQNFLVQADGVYLMGSYGAESLFSNYGFYVNDVANKIYLSDGSTPMVALRGGDVLSVWFEMNDGTRLYGTDAREFYLGSLAAGMGGETPMGWSSLATGQTSDYAHLGVGFFLSDGTAWDDGFHSWMMYAGEYPSTSGQPLPGVFAALALGGAAYAARKKARRA